MVREVKIEKLLFFFPLYETPFTGLESVYKMVITSTTGIVLKDIIGKDRNIHFKRFPFPNAPP